MNTQTSNQNLFFKVPSGVLDSYKLFRGQRVNYKNLHKNFMFGLRTVYLTVFDHMFFKALNLFIIQLALRTTCRISTFAHAILVQL